MCIDEVTLAVYGECDSGAGHTYREEEEPAPGDVRLISAFRRELELRTPWCDFSYSSNRPSWSQADYFARRLNR